MAETDAPGADLPEWTVTLEKAQEWSSWGLGVEARLHYIEITEVDRAVFMTGGVGWISKF